MTPRIFLSCGPMEMPGAIIVDYKNSCLWRDGVRKLKNTGRNGINLRFRLLSTLLVCSPNVLSRADIVDAMWGDYEDGGPVDAVKSLHITICQLRDVQEWLTGRIRNRIGLGLSFEFDAAPALQVAA